MPELNRSKVREFMIKWASFLPVEVAIGSVKVTAAFIFIVALALFIIRGREELAGSHGKYTVILGRIRDLARMAGITIGSSAVFSLLIVFYLKTLSVIGFARHVDLFIRRQVMPDFILLRPFYRAFPKRPPIDGDYVRYLKERPRLPSGLKGARITSEGDYEVDNILGKFLNRVGCIEIFAAAGIIAFIVYSDEYTLTGKSFYNLAWSSIVVWWCILRLIHFPLIQYTYRTIRKEDTALDEPPPIYPRRSRSGAERGEDSADVSEPASYNEQSKAIVTSDSRFRMTIGDMVVRDRSRAEEELANQIAAIVDENTAGNWEIELAEFENFRVTLENCYSTDGLKLKLVADDKSYPVTELTDSSATPNLIALIEGTVRRSRW